MATTVEAARHLRAVGMQMARGVHHLSIQTHTAVRLKGWNIHIIPTNVATPTPRWGGKAVVVVVAVAVVVVRVVATVGRARMESAACARLMSRTCIRWTCNRHVRCMPPRLSRTCLGNGVEVVEVSVRAMPAGLETLGMDGHSHTTDGAHPTPTAATPTPTATATATATHPPTTTAATCRHSNDATRWLVMRTHPGAIRPRMPFAVSLLRTEPLTPGCHNAMAPENNCTKRGASGTPTDKCRGTHMHVRPRMQAQHRESGSTPPLLPPPRPFDPDVAVSMDPRLPPCSAGMKTKIACNVRRSSQGASALPQRPTRGVWRNHEPWVPTTATATTTTTTMTTNTRHGGAMIAIRAPDGGYLLDRRRSSPNNRRTSHPARTEGPTLCRAHHARPRRCDGLQVCEMWNTTPLRRLHSNMPRPAPRSMCHSSSGSSSNHNNKVGQTSTTMEGQQWLGPPRWRV